MDVGVICPSAAGAGLDCVVTMEQRKRDRLLPYTDELEASGVEYHPFAVSCWGRLHPSALQMLQNAAKRIARRDATTTQRARLKVRVSTEVCSTCRTNGFALFAACGAGGCWSFV